MESLHLSVLYTFFYFFKFSIHEISKLLNVMCFYGGKKKTPPKTKSCTVVYSTVSIGFHMSPFSIISSSWLYISHHHRHCALSNLASKLSNVMLLLDTSFHIFIFIIFGYLLFYCYVSLYHTYERDHPLMVSIPLL